MRNLLLFLLFSGLCRGQQKPYLPEGQWVVVKSEIKDGSKSLKPEEDTEYTEYDIGKKQVCITLDALHRGKNDTHCLGYSLFGATVRLANFTSYAIERATADTLVLAEVNDKTSADKLQRLTMVPKTVLTNAERSKYAAGSTVTASRYFTPTCNYWVEDELYKAFKKDITEFAFAGKIVFYPAQGKLETVVTTFQGRDSLVVNKVKKIVDKSYKNWNLSAFTAYSSIELPFVLLSQDNYFYHSIRFYYFTNDITAVRFKQGSVFDKGLGKAAYEQGLRALQYDDFKEAVELFEYAYQLDPLNLDAIYNKAASYYKAGDLENACLTWREIADMGQAEAATMVKTYCDK